MSRKRGLSRALLFTDGHKDCIDAVIPPVFNDKSERESSPFSCSGGKVNGYHTGSGDDHDHKHAGSEERSNRQLCYFRIWICKRDDWCKNISSSTAESDESDAGDAVWQTKLSGDLRQGRDKECICSETKTEAKIEAPNCIHNIEENKRPIEGFRVRPAFMTESFLSVLDEATDGSAAIGLIQGKGTVLRWILNYYIRKYGLIWPTELISGR